MIALSRSVLGAWFVIAIAAGEAPLTLAFLRGERVVEVLALEDDEEEGQA